MSDKIIMFPNTNIVVQADFTYENPCLPKEQEVIGTGTLTGVADGQPDMPVLFEYQCQFLHHPISKIDFEFSQPFFKELACTILHYCSEACAGDINKVPKKIYILYSSTRTARMWETIYKTALDGFVVVVGKSGADGKKTQEFLTEHYMKDYFSTGFMVYNKPIPEDATDEEQHAIMEENTKFTGLFFSKYNYEDSHFANKYATSKLLENAGNYVDKSKFREPTAEDMLRYCAYNAVKGNSDRNLDVAAKAAKSLTVQIEDLTKQLKDTEQKYQELQLAHNGIQQQGMNYFNIDWDFISQLFDSIDVNPGEQSRIDINVITHDIIIEKVNLGKIKGIVQLFPNKIKARVEPTESTIPSKSGYLHPHASSGNNMCVGDIDTVVQQAFQEGNITRIFGAIYNLFHSYNPSSPHCAIENWDPNIE